MCAAEYDGTCCFRNLQAMAEGVIAVLSVECGIMNIQNGEIMKARTELISVRLTPEEKRRMEYCAEMMGITQTELLVRGINRYYDSVKETIKKLNQ